jgi:hypothetical protein
MASHTVNTSTWARTMVLKRLEFSWEVAKSGYHWKPPKHSRPRDAEERIPRREWDSERVRFLKELEEPEAAYYFKHRLVPTNPQGGSRTYYPLIDAPDLFITLAALKDACGAPRLPPTDEQLSPIQDFANQYGTLLPWSSRTAGVYWSDWFVNVHNLHLAVALWRLSVSWTPGEARTLVESAPTSITVLSGGEIFPLSEVSGEFYRAPSKNHAHQAALAFVNDVLRRGGASMGPTTQIQPGRKWGLPELALQPRSLIGAAWVQLIYAITHGSGYRTCKWCDAGFQIRPGFERETREYCSRSCVSMASRARVTARLRKKLSRRSVKKGR